MPSFTQTLAQRGVLLLDGGMGSQLQAAGLPAGQAPEVWNLERPQEVARVHAAYADAGCDAVTTNSFGGSPLKLAHYGLAERCEEVNRVAVELARRAAPGCLVLGSVGPCGQLLAPLGPAKPEEVKIGFRRQIAGLLEGGCDLVLLETFSDLAEAVLALEAARELDPRAPCAASMTYQQNPRGYFTLMGQDPARAAQGLAQAGALAVGCNCGQGGEQMAGLVAQLVAASPVPVIAQPNAGLPKLVDGCTVYEESPERTADWIGKILAAGATLVGGCCGTTPAHLAALRPVVDAWRARTA